MFNEDFKLHADEKVILYVRRHWLFFLIDIVEVLAYFFGIAVFVWFVQYLGLLDGFNLFGHFLFCNVKYFALYVGEYFVGCFWLRGLQTMR
jgi:hypothetical protein